jgi:thioesterase domain-containing protein
LSQSVSVLLAERGLIEDLSVAQLQSHYSAYLQLATSPIVVNGGHHSMLMPPHVAELAHHIQRLVGATSKEGLVA